jgi:hypothetical protein
MASHLHRYKAELEIMKQVLEKLAQAVASGDNSGTKNAGSLINLAESNASAIHIVTAQIEALQILAVELEQKIQAVLALVSPAVPCAVAYFYSDVPLQLFQIIQSSHNQVLVKNSKSMEAILKSTRDEARFSRQMAKESQAMAREMRKDSISMKTVGSPHSPIES